MKILAIDTSCDETAVAVTSGRRILSNEIYSQVLIHKKWGGVVPNLAKRAHIARIDMVIKTALKKSNLDFSDLDFIAVTFGPGLAVALEVGIAKAKALSQKFGKKLISVNHMEGHIYSCFAQNSAGNPKHDFTFPYLALLVSGGHTELVLFKDHIKYEVLGETVDDAAGEALDKAAKMMGLGYPGGVIIERLALGGEKDYHRFPRPLSSSKNLNFSFSGLKTSLYYFYNNLNEDKCLKNLNNIAASYQEAVFDSLLIKLNEAIKRTEIKNILCAGGVSSNLYLRKRVRQLTRKQNVRILFPPFKNLYGDNAAMIGIAAYYKVKKRQFVTDLNELDRVPRARLSQQPVPRPPTHSSEGGLPLSGHFSE